LSHVNRIQFDFGKLSLQEHPEDINIAKQVLKTKKEKGIRVTCSEEQKQPCGQNPRKAASMVPAK